MKYEAPKHGRIKHTFIGMINFNGWWWVDSLKEWRRLDNIHGLEFSSQCDCNSIRAFRKRLKKAPKNVEFILVSRWKGFDVIGKNTTKWEK